MNDQIHHVPGRLRVRVPAIKKSGYQAALLGAALRKTAGIFSAEPNVITGSIVIRYDQNSTSASAILGYLRERGDIGSDRPQASVRMRNKIAEALVWYCLEIAVERAVFSMLAAIL
jgi:Heavy metal associated domain 2